mgnify:CR=1 FL=1
MTCFVLKLHALEHLNLITLSKETTVDYNESPNLKQLSLRNIQDKIPIELRALNCNLIFMGADIFTKIKMNLALQYQAQLVQAHPGWKLNDFIEDPSISDSVRDNVWVHDESSPWDLVMQANEKLVQSLHIFEEEADNGKQSVMSKIGLVIMHYLQLKSSKELLKAILHVCLTGTQNMVKGSSLLLKSNARWESSVNMWCNWSACNYHYLERLECLTILYIASCHFNFNTNGVYFFVEKKFRTI